MIKLNNYDQQSTATFRLSGEQNCYWLPDSESVPRNAVFIGDRVVLKGGWGSIFSTSDEDGLIRVTLDGTTIGSYYAVKDHVTGWRWDLEVDITYLLKDLAEVEDIRRWNTTYRTYRPRTLSVTTENTGSVSCSIDIVILNGHSMLRMAHPIYEEIMNVDSGYPTSNAGRARIDPPNVMLWGGTEILEIECGDGWYIVDNNGVVTNDNIYTLGGYSNGNGATVGIQPIAYPNGIAYRGKDKNYIIKFQEIDRNTCGDYCSVRWKSCTGNWRNHMFEVRNITSNLDGSTMTDQLGTEYRTINGTSYQLDIHLSGLTRYGLWYYQDMLTSEEIYVDCYKNGFLDEFVHHVEVPCSVVSPKKYTVPNGNGKLYDFDCTLKYKKIGY
ncbi:MAG: hypothetical protein IIZ78_12115 [Clostridiales bacterium]|nr:hypothetical protein [Clostridiales bacterium]